MQTCLTADLEDDGSEKEHFLHSVGHRPSGAPTQNGRAASPRIEAMLKRFERSPSLLGILSGPEALSCCGRGEENGAVDLCKKFNCRGCLKCLS